MKKLLFIFIIISVFVGSSCHSHRIFKVKHPIDTSSVVLIDTVILGYVSPLNNVNLQLDLYQQGVRFYSFSSWEAWDLQLHTDSIFRLTTYTHGTLSFPYTEPSIAQDGNIVRYMSSKDGHEIEITIRQDWSCEDEKGAVNYPFATTILFKTADGKQITYTGCGFYLANPILNDIWALERMNGKNYRCLNIQKWCSYT